MPTGSKLFSHSPPIELGEFLGVVENPQFNFDTTPLTAYAKWYAFQEYLMDLNWEGLQVSIFCTEHPVKQWHQQVGRPSYHNLKVHQRARQHQAAYISGIQNNSSKILTMYIYRNYTVFVGKLFRSEKKPLMHAVFIYDQMDDATWINITTWQEELELYHVLRRGKLG